MDVILKSNQWLWVMFLKKYVIKHSWIKRYRNEYTMRNSIYWIVIIIFSAAFLWWIYQDGKIDDLINHKIKDYSAAEIFTVLYLILIIFSFVLSLFHLLWCIESFSFKSHSSKYYYFSYRPFLNTGESWGLVVFYTPANNRFQCGRVFMAPFFCPGIINLLSFNWTCCIIFTKGEAGLFPTI